MTQTDTRIKMYRDLQDRDKIPRAMVRGMFALVMSVLVLVSYARFVDRPLEAVAPRGNVVAERTFLLKGELSGAATVKELDGTMIADLSPEKGGFISGIYRVIIRERTKHRVALDGPVVLQRHDTGRLSINDPSTGWRADLMGFGIDNARAFARLLD